MEKQNELIGRERESLGRNHRRIGLREEELKGMSGNKIIEN